MTLLFYHIFVKNTVTCFEAIILN